MSPDSIFPQAARSFLLENLVFLFIASVVLVAGVSAVLLAAFGSRDRLLLWLGVFSILYAVRLFVKNGLVYAAIGGAEQTFFLWSIGVTYVIVIPYGLFARELLGSGWKRSISAWLWIEIAFAVIAVPTIFYRRPDSVNSILVMAGTLLLSLHVVASMLKVCFAAQQTQADDPAKILAGLHSMLRGSLGGRYVTASCAAIDLGNQYREVCRSWPSARAPTSKRRRGTAPC